MIDEWSGATETLPIMGITTHVDSQVQIHHSLFVCLKKKKEMSSAQQIQLASHWVDERLKKQKTKAPNIDKNLK
jgi:hypothetical protein